MRFILELVMLVTVFGMVSVSMACIGNANTQADLEKIILEINGQPSQVPTMIADKLVSK